MQNVLFVDSFGYLLGPTGPFSSSGASGAGGGVQQVYQGRNPSPPDDPTIPAIDFPVGGGGMTEWDVPSQQWL